MEVSHEILKTLISGAYWFKKIDDYLAFYRCSEEQIENLKYDEFFYVRTKFSSSIHFDFETEAREISFFYKIVNISLRDSFDLYINDILAVVKSCENLPVEGKMRFDLPKGKKRVRLYFPVDAEIRIKNFQSDKFCEPYAKGLNVLWIGDSITQGAGSFMGSQTYVNIVSQQLNYNSLNQGIGGFRYDSRILEYLTEFLPDKIIISLGTNDRYDNDFLFRLQDFYAKLNDLYQNIPVIVITPVWRGDSEERFEEIGKISNAVIAVCKKYSNIKIINGLELVPHVSQCFWDNLHPNAWGMQLYAENLIKKLKR